VRFDPYSANEHLYRDLLSLNRHLSEGSLEEGLRQLVEIRVSQISGCGFCLAMHTLLARKAGVPHAKLDTLAGWREESVFEERERAALGLAETMTRIGDGAQVEDAIWSAARNQFDDDELAALLYLIGLINVFNRINIAVELPSGYRLPKLSAT
jgi:AhpD family alkylhydroperoxidase